MKKRAKKLVLAKETVREMELGNLAGGVSSIDVACGGEPESVFPNRCPRKPNIYG